MLNTKDLNPLMGAIIKQSASPVSIVDKSLNKLVDEMAESHWLTLVDTDEQNDFINDLEVLGFTKTAKKLVKERSMSRREYNDRIRNLSNDQDGLD